KDIPRDYFRVGVESGAGAVVDRSGAVHAFSLQALRSETVLRFQSPLIKPCMRFFRTRLSEVFHRTAFGVAVAHVTVPCSRCTPSFSSSAHVWRFRARSPRLALLTRKITSRPR